MRSLLFVPGDSERKLARCLEAGADALILDLEDAVAAPAKAQARALTEAFLGAHRGTSAPRLYVRINALETGEWEADLAAVLPHAPFGIVVPKTRSGADVHTLSIALHHGEERAGTAPGSTRILAIATEVPASLLALPSYIGASTRLESLAWGAEDLSAALGARTSRDEAGTLSSPFRLARDLCLVTAAAAGVAAVDTVYLDYTDADGLAREARAAARDGFSGKLAIHPAQVPVINEAFTPAAAEIGEARAVVEAFRAAPASGVVAHAGRMLDRPHLVRAERVLARARAAGLDL
jgi:citrate lyase subunit beta / citryl-CoA lyase